MNVNRFESYAEERMILKELGSRLRKQWKARGFEAHLGYLGPRLIYIPLSTYYDPDVFLRIPLLHPILLLHQRGHWICPNHNK